MFIIIYEHIQIMDTTHIVYNYLNQTKFLLDEKKRVHEQRNEL